MIKGKGVIKGKLIIHFLRLLCSFGINEERSVPTNGNGSIKERQEISNRERKKDRYKQSREETMKR